MRALYLVIGIALFAGSVAAFGSRTHLLSAAECENVSGAVNNKVCRGVGTCNDYGYQNGMPGCPGFGCQVCELTGYRWEVCQAQIGSDCSSSPTPNDCGKLYQGFCSGSICQNLVWYGDDCPDAPNCY